MSQAECQKLNIQDVFLNPSYTHLAKELPRHIFTPNPARLFHMVLLMVLAAAAVTAMVVTDWHWSLKIILGGVVGHCWGIGGLIAHEILHGSVIRSRKWQDTFSLFLFAPFLISPTFWRFWHNKLHHANTQRLIADPDAYPTYRVFQASKYMNWMYPFTPGSGAKRSYLYFFFWFSFNVLVAQLYLRFRNRTFDSLDHRKVNFELGTQILLAALFLVAIGPQNWLWAVFVPVVVQNYIVFSYISTNHNLNPLTKHNDPLANTLTVTNHPWLEKLHVNFGYHVEHHMFPTVNGIHVKTIHELLKAKYPTEYHFMPKWQAIRSLYATARIYKDQKTLMNPLNKKTFKTLGSPEEQEVALYEFMAEGRSEVSL